jgi:hypothetical protein
MIDLLQPLAVVMTTPTFNNLITMLSGWVFAPRRTVTGMIVTAQAVGLKHHATFHRLFAQAVWSLDELGLAVYGLIRPFLDAPRKRRGGGGWTTRWPASAPHQVSHHQILRAQRYNRIRRKADFGSCDIGFCSHA